jgi:hypothetical protein
MSEEQAQRVPPPGDETYLGDGLYASFDGYQIRLRAPREGTDHFICMEPEVWQTLRFWLHHYQDMANHMDGVRKP